MILELFGPVALGLVVEGDCHGGTDYHLNESELRVLDKGNILR